MTSRQGRRVRRKVPSINRTAEDNRPLPEITCPHCKEIFTVDFEKPLCPSLACPHCGASVTEADYAKAAALLGSKQLEYDSLVRKLSYPAKTIRSFTDACNGVLPTIIRAVSNACSWLLERLTSIPISWVKRRMKTASMRSKTSWPTTDTMRQLGTAEPEYPCSIAVKPRLKQNTAVPAYCAWRREAKTLTTSGQSESSPYSHSSRNKPNLPIRRYSGAFSFRIFTSPFRKASTGTECPTGAKLIW